MPTTKNTTKHKSSSGPKYIKPSTQKKSNSKKTNPTKQKTKLTLGKHLVVSNSKEADELREAIKNGKAIVLYHAEWCGHCKDFMPEWRKFVAVMKNKSDVDCITAEVESANLGLLPEAGVQGFPTIRYYNSNPRASMPSENTEKATGLAALFGLADEMKPAKNIGANNTVNGIDYAGSRTSDALLEYVMKNSKPQSGGGPVAAPKKPSKQHNNGIFKTLLKEGLNPKALTPAFKKEYGRLEKASRHAKKTLREIKSSLGFKA